MNSVDQHAVFMARAIQAGQRSSTYPFGAVLVHMDSGEIVAEAWNETDRNPLLHAELSVINNYAHEVPDADWSALVLYTTAEPCAMCQSAIVWTGLSAVYYGTSIPALHQMGVRQINLRAEEVAARTPFHHLRIIGGLLEDECSSLFQDAVENRRHREDVSMEAIDHASLSCPHCGELVEVSIDMAAAHQRYIEDCSVCCRPMVIRIDREGADAVRAFAESESD